MQKIKIISDHCSLCSLLKARSPKSARLTRWLAQLQDYQLEIVYTSGKTHLAADCLSRLIPIEEKTHPFDGDDTTTPSDQRMTITDTDFRVNLKTAQREDPNLLPIIDQITQSPDSSHRYVIVDNLLFYFDGSKRRFVVPSTYVPRLLQAYHGSSYAAHLGEIGRGEEKLAHLGLEKLANRRNSTHSSVAHIE
jgi:hypothetical protein